MKFKRMRKITNALMAEINSMKGEKELRCLVGECHNVTTTNCSWIMYRLKEIVLSVAQNRLKWIATEKSLREANNELPT